MTFDQPTKRNDLKSQMMLFSALALMMAMSYFMARHSIAEHLAIVGVAGSILAVINLFMPKLRATLSANNAERCIYLYVVIQAIGIAIFLLF